MSERSKVYHVLVEVRSVPEREGNGASDLEVVGTATPMGEEVRMHRSANPGANKLSEGGCPMNSGSFGGDRNFSPSRSPHTSSQCDTSESSSNLNQRGPPCNGIDRLLSAVLNPSDNDAGMAAPSSPKCKSSQGQASRSPSATSGRWGGDGQRSVVTFSYIEKANVRTVQSPVSAPRRTPASYSSDSPSLHRSAEGSPLAAAPHLGKRMSTPVYFYSPDSSCHSSPALSLRASGGPRADPAPSSITRPATHHASEELRSPEVKRRAASGPAERLRQQSRCQSWAGTLDPACGSSTFPIAQPRGPDWLNPPCDRPRNPTQNHHSSRVAFRPTSATPPSLRAKRSQVAPIPAQRLGVKGGPGSDPFLARRVNLPPGDSFSSAGQGINQLSGLRTATAAESPQTARRLTNDVAGPSSGFTETRKGFSLSSQGDVLEPGSPKLGQEGQPCQAPENRLTVMNIPVESVPEVSPSTGADQHHSLPMWNKESGGRERVPVGSPALPARLYRFNMCPADMASPLKDPRLQRATIRDTESPTLHRRQPPQYTGENWSPSPVHKLVMKESPEPSVKLYVEQRGRVPDVEAPVSWTSRQQYGGAPEWGVDSPKVGQQAEGCTGGAPPVRLQKEAELRTREALLLGPVVLDHPQGQEAGNEQQSSLAQGSWTVLPKTEEEQQPACSPDSGEQGCTSPESTLSSHRSFEMGHTTSGIQVRMKGSCCTELTNLCVGLCACICLYVSMWVYVHVLSLK